jgi:hypothetical protein
MKKAKSKVVDIRPEYDFSGGVRGKYAERYAEGSNVVVLDPDVAQRFGSSEAVNRALRSLVDLADRKVKSAKGAPRAQRSGAGR